MIGTVYLTNIEPKDIEKAKKEFAEKYPGDEYGTVEFVVREEEIDYGGDNSIIIILAEQLDLKKRKEICVSIEINVEELLESDAFWKAIEHYVERQEEQRRRFNLMKKMLEAYKEAKK